MAVELLAEIAAEPVVVAAELLVEAVADSAAAAEELQASIAAVLVAVVTVLLAEVEPVAAAVGIVVGLVVVAVELLMEVAAEIVAVAVLSRVHCFVVEKHLLQQMRSQLKRSKTQTDSWLIPLFVSLYYQKNISFFRVFEILTINWYRFIRMNPLLYHFASVSHETTEKQKQNIFVRVNRHHNR